MREKHTLHSTRARRHVGDISNNDYHLISNAVNLMCSNVCDWPLRAASLLILHIHYSVAFSE